MADQTLDQLPQQLVAEDTDNLYAVRNGNSIAIRRAALINGRTPETRKISTSNGIKGGGDLTEDREHQLDIAGLPEDSNPDAAFDFVVTHDASESAPRKVRISSLPGGSVGATSPNFGAVAVAGQTNLVASLPGDSLNLAQGANITLTTDAATNTVTVATNNLVTQSRSISAGEGLSGGGTLAANRSLAVNINGLSEDLAPDLSSDVLMTYDASAGVLRKVKLSLLSSTAYTLPQASATVLGGIKIGSGLIMDAGTGVVSVVPTGTSYVLPPATTTTRGGVIVGAGLDVNNGVISNPNSTPFILKPPTANQIGGVKQGPGVQIAEDGTISATGGGTSDGAYRPEGYGCIKGVGLSQAQREANASAIVKCWADAAGAGGRVDMGGGVIEIYGPLSISNVSGFAIDGDWCTIHQFQDGVSVVNLSTASQIRFKGFRLRYQNAQTTGADVTTGETYAAALRINEVSNCHFENIDTTAAWVHVGMSGGAGSSSNTFINIKCNVATGQAWGLAFKTGSGNTFTNFRVTGNNVQASIQGGAYISAVDQAQFTGLRFDYITSRRTIAVVASRGLMVSGFTLDNIKPTASGGYGGIVHGANGSIIQFAGTVFRNTILDGTGLSITDASFFTGDLGASFVVSNLTITNTTKVGTVKLALLGNISSAPALNLSGVFQQVRLDTASAKPHRIDELCYATVDPSSESLDGPLMSFNNVVGDVTGGLVSFGDESATVYPAFHGRHLRWNAPLTVDRTVTVSQYIDRAYASATITAPRTVKGARIRITRSAAATGAALLTIANYDSSTITTLSANQAAELIFTGSAWALLPGGFASGGGGGSTGVFATKTEAESGTSATTYMSPVRTRDAMVAYAAGNELTGSPGQFLGFNALGNAAVLPNTKTMMIAALADTTAVAVGSGIRKLPAPIPLKLSEIRVYLPTTGTTATTVDVKVNGVSALTAPITVASNTASSSSNSFNASLTGSTIPNGAIVTIDVTAAGTGAKGLYITLVGTEV